MLGISKRKLFYMLSIGVFLLSSACNGELAQEATPAPQTVVVTQVVTQVILPTETPAPSPTPDPTATPQPTETAAPVDPYSAPIYYPLSDCAASRLHIGDQAFVTYGGGPNAIRYGSNLQLDTVLAYAEEGELLEIIDGPFCSWGWIVWLVSMTDGTVGYTPEGNGEEYWLLPVTP